MTGRATGNSDAENLPERRRATYFTVTFLSIAHVMGLSVLQGVKNEVRSDDDGIDRVNMARLTATGQCVKMQ